MIAHTWAALDPVRSYCEAEGIPVSDRREARDRPQISDLVEYRMLSRWLETAVLAHGPVEAVRDWLRSRGAGPIWQCLRDLVAGMDAEFGAPEIAIRDALGWIADWGREFGGMGEGLVLTTAHSAKGLEFDHVVVLDDAWQPRPNTDPDEQRRLFYVAMTRARRSLSIIEAQAPHALLGADALPAAFLRRRGRGARRPVGGDRQALPAGHRP